MMQWLVEQFVERPLAAFISSVEILGHGLQRGQTFDAIVGRIIHTLSCPCHRSGEPEDVVITPDREAGDQDRVHAECGSKPRR
jgi:hypothetical protein